MATSYSREQIVDLAVQMLGAGATLDDAINAAANYGVDLASVYYSEPGTTVSVDVPADTGPVDTGPVDTGPVDTGPVDTGPVDTGPVSSEPAYTQKQYQDAGQFIAQNIDKPEVIAQVAQDLNLSTQDILTAVQTVNQDITKADVENYLTKATSTVDTGPVDTNVGSPLSTVSSSPVDTGPVDTGPVDTGPVDANVGSPLSTVSSSPVNTVVTSGALPTSGDTSTSVSSPLSSVASSGTPALNLDDEVKDIKSYWKTMTGQSPTISDEEIASYIKNNPETYNLDLLWLAEQNNPSLTPVSTPDTVIGALGNDTVAGGLDTLTGGAGNDSSSLMLTDYQGNQFNVNQLKNLAGQVISNLDPKSTGGVYGVGNGQSIGFDYDQAQKFFGEDKPFTVGDQVLLDISRGLLNEGITDLKQLEGAKLLGNGGRGLQYYQLADGRVLTTKGGNFKVGETFTGEGKTTYTVNLSSGKPVISTTGVDTSDRGTIAFGLTMLSLGMGGPAALGSALTGGAATGLTAAAIGSSALGFANSLVMGNTPIEALKDAVKSGGAAYLGPTISSMLPADLQAVGGNAVNQLISTGKIDPSKLLIAGGVDYAAGEIASETGMSKADALKLANAGVSAIQGNPMGALTSLAQAGLKGALSTDTVSGSGAIDEYNVTGGGGALISSGNPAEDEQIALGQLNQAATSLVSDYVAAAGSMEPTDLRAALSKLTDPYGKPISSETVDRLVNSAQSQLDTRVRNEKVQNDTLGVLADYTGRDSDLSRESAYERLVAAGNSGDRANEILAGVDAQVEANRAARAATQTQNQAAIKAGAGEFDGADARSAVAAGAGEFTGADAAAKANQRIQDQTTFANAFAVAREEFGPNATFNWNGKLYSTATAEERPDLTGKVDSTSQTTETPYVAPNGMHNRAAFIQAGGGTSDADYAKYVQAVNAVIAEGKSGTLITPASVNSTGKEMPSTTGPVTMEKPRVDSVLGSVAAQGVASFGANSIAGVLNSLGFTDAGKTVLDKANQIAAAATAAEGADITKGKADINAAIKKVGESSDIKDFAANVGNLASTAFNNPKAFGATVGSEVVEELLQFATLKFPASFLVKETVASALENAGAAYNTEYESQIAKGASKEDAHQAAQKAAGTAAGVSVALGGAAAGLGKVAGKVIGSQADEVPTSGVGQVGKTTLKESAQETVEEGSIAGAIDLALGRPVDAVNVLTNMTGGALYGGPTSGVMQATKLDTLDQTASTSIGSGLGADSISASIKSGASIDTTVKSALDAGADTTVVVGAAINSALDAGMSTGTVVSSTVGSAVRSGADSTIVIDRALSAVAQSGGDVSQAAGSAVTASLNAGANANETIIAATSSAIKNGGDVGSAVTTVIAGAVQGGASLSDASASSVATAIIGGANADTVIKAVTDSNSGVSVKADTGNNVTTVVASDATSNTKVVMDSNSQSVVTTTTDTNTGTKTQTTMQGNTTITTTTDTNTGITTQTTTNTNTNSTTTVNTNTNTTTNTTTNNNTNTTTNTSVNTDTGDAVITVVDDKTGEVIDTKITTIDQLSTDVKETLKVDATTGTTTDKTTTTKAPAVKAPAVTMPKAATAGAGMSLIGDIGRLPGTMLKTAGDPRLKDPLAALSQKVEEMNQIDPALLAVMAQRLGMQMPQAPQEPTFTYGQETSIDDILGLREPKAPEEEEAAFAEGGFVEPLRAKAMNPQFMNHGGALPGGRENFKHGKHVAGEGDGQSDDIPAWLADGEFVFPADVVSALGNGSTKAGTDKLYKMMHEIRARARSTKVKDLPPPAHKSPLDYLKRGK
jgi:hypothetical protein